MTENLQVFEIETGLELVINTHTGEVFASKRALARICEKDEKTIRNWIGAENILIKSAKIPTNGGFQGADLVSEEGIFQALVKYNPELLAKCAKAGLITSPFLMPVRLYNFINLVL